MIVFVIAVIASLIGVGFYHLLSEQYLKVGIGFLLLSNGVNLGVMTATGRIPDGAVSPLIREGIPLNFYVDPLPQAFVLTAIVISLGVMAFLFAMIIRLHGRHPQAVTEEEEND